MSALLSACCQINIWRPVCTPPQNKRVCVFHHLLSSRRWRGNVATATVGLWPSHAVARSNLTSSAVTAAPSCRPGITLTRTCCLQ